MRTILFSIFCALLLSGYVPQVAHAQQVGGLPVASDMRPMGVALGKYETVSPIPAFVEADCGTIISCNVIINTSYNYDWIGLYYDMRKSGDFGPPKWTPNQFDTLLPPNGYRVQAQYGDESTCSVLVRAVFRNRNTGEVVDTILPEQYAISLCKPPKPTNTAFPLRIDREPRPNIILEDGESEEFPPERVAGIRQ